MLTHSGAASNRHNLEILRTPPLVQMGLHVLCLGDALLRQWNRRRPRRAGHRQPSEAPHWLGGQRLRRCSAQGRLRIPDTPLSAVLPEKRLLAG